ncbi:MAG: hypothetical protein EZS28_026604 [Streblomastix strix]|uniref:TRAF-type domain-containing protein n=1 Tax=Streblomastix strix TaxID=222440 RepID=A0A5J4V515_9EUKA|nr:MAG: hypothetical protein EZS28_026604 [Streblomastix strix]
MNHKLDDCQKRIVGLCPYCGIELLPSTVDSHIEQCGSRADKCQKCNSNIWTNILNLTVKISIWIKNNFNLKCNNNQVRIFFGCMHNNCPASIPLTVDSAILFQEQISTTLDKKTIEGFISLLSALSCTPSSQAHPFDSKITIQWIECASHQRMDPIFAPCFVDFIQTVTPYICETDSFKDEKGRFIQFLGEFRGQLSEFQKMHRPSASRMDNLIKMLDRGEMPPGAEPLQD